MIPDRLEDWTYEAIQTLCQVGQSESDRHDFKFDLANLKEPEKICCAFANSEGGFIVVGIKEKQRIFTIEGIDPDNELYGNFLKRIKIEPALDVPHPKVIGIPNSEKKLYVIEIPKSSKRPHIPSVAEKRYFYKRHGSNCIQMTLEEIRYQIHNYEEKRDKLTLLFMELEFVRSMIVEQSQKSIGQYHGANFSFEVIDKILVETYSFLKEDLDTITRLGNLKLTLMHLNFEKSKLLSMIAMSYDLESKKQFTVDFRNQVLQNMPAILSSIDYINKALKERFGLVNPYYIARG